MIFSIHNIATLVLLLVSVVFPLISSFLTKAHWPPEIAGLITLALSLIAGLVTEWAQAGDHYNWRVAVSTALSSFVVAAIARARIWIGSLIDGKLLAVGSKPRA